MKSAFLFIFAVITVLIHSQVFALEQDAKNVALSKSRADAIVKLLVDSYGIEKARLRTIGVGPSSPAQSNRSEKGRGFNRRVELVTLSAPLN